MKEMRMTNAPVEARGSVISITLIEPYPLVRATLREIIGREADMQIAAEFATVEEAIGLVREDPTDVVLVDTDLAVAALVPALQELKRAAPASAVIVLGHRRGDEELFRAIEAGAAAHLLDAVRSVDLVNTIRAVASGEYVIDASVAARPEVARRVLDAFRATSLNHAAARTRSRRAFEQLSGREAQILTLISQGMANKDVAATLSISQHTVNNYVKAVLRKLAVNNRTQAVLVALRESWIRLPDQPIHRDH
jgi:DNA-binding NarL/FixJ family response regulator